jgi:hypothetical protein
VRLPQNSHELTLAELWKLAQADLESAEVMVEFSRDVIHKLACPHCGAEEEQFVPVGALRFEQGACPSDGHMRIVHTAHSFSGTEAFGGRTLDQLGLPRFDIFLARSATREMAYLLDGDRETVLGPLVKEDA